MPKIIVKKVKRVTKPAKKVYAHRITKLMEEKEMIVQELADKAGIGQSHLSRIIHNNRKNISLMTAWDIADALGEKIEDVFIKEAPKK